MCRYAPRSRLRTQHNTYQAGLQGLLVGHEDWVHSVMWQPGVGQQEAYLLSSSMDRTMMLWRRDADTGKASGPQKKAAVQHVEWGNQHVQMQERVPRAAVKQAETTVLLH